MFDALADADALAVLVALGVAVAVFVGVGVAGFVGVGVIMAGLAVGAGGLVVVDGAVV
ncbi:MAG TPA: hypothetical protein VG164_15025 [Trebonia sp.]|nr:hypothetical protein [Trebonia sp.]